MSNHMGGTKRVKQLPYLLFAVRSSTRRGKSYNYSAAWVSF
ncbi:hypothetical protein ACFFNY_26555 [Paenibacillus hodogayensis]|uniref:Uncharacterized protein n=1 Tax=Paenibacillus hodogayensis TaxID=279208 RepID=A0ABV5W410_9BACL